MDIHLKKSSGLGLIVLTVTIGAILLEILFDAIGLERHKHLIGNIGSIILLISFVYSLRKRKIIFKSGNIQTWLKYHEAFAIIGTVLILVHAGFHTHAAVPLITLALIFVSFVSGLVGSYVYDAGRNELKIMREYLKTKGLTPAQIEETLKPMLEANKKFLAWRAFHMPIVSALFIFVFFHIISALYYGGF